MIKERIGDIVYYYSDHSYDSLMGERLLTDKHRSEKAYAVIDIVERKILKTRWDLERVFDTALRGV